MSLRIIATGGTFDKHYDPLTGALVFADSILPAAIAQARLRSKPVIEALLALDSVDMQDSHREQIAVACERAPESHIVIVHGTDTMRESAERVAAAQLQKTIVLTGAMVPYRVNGSDALFNLGFACAAAQLAAPGVYIAMNGELFMWDNVIKNRAAGHFQTRHPIAQNTR